MYEISVAVSSGFEVFNTPEDPVELWENFKLENLEADMICINECLRSRCVSEENATQ